MTALQIEPASFESASQGLDDSGRLRRRVPRRLLRAIGAQVFWHMAWQVRTGPAGTLLAVGGFVFDHGAGGYEAWFMAFPPAKGRMRTVLAAARDRLEFQAGKVSVPIFVRVNRHHARQGKRIAGLLGFAYRGALPDGTDLYEFERGS